jgi:hypothetical protein
MSEPKNRTLEDAGGMELLRALGDLVVKGAKGLPGQVASKAHDLVNAGGGKIDAAICTAVRKHLDDCAKCRAHAAKAIAKAAKAAKKGGKAKPAKAAKKAGKA